MVPKILFACSTPNHVRVFSPVARVLADSPNAPVIRWLSLDAYYRQGVERTLREHGWPEHITLPRPPGDTGTPWEGGPLARIRILRQGKRAVHRLMRDIQPDVIVLGNDIGTLERLLIGEAHALHAPSLLVQEGVLAQHEEPFARFSLPRRTVHRIMTAMGLRLADPRPCGLNGADHVAVMGEAMAEWLVEHGLSPTQVTVTGQPRYDFLYALKHRTLNPTPLSVRLPDADKIVLFASQPYVRYGMCSVAEARRIWQTVINGVKGLGDGHHLVAKLHPAEDVERTRHWLADILPAEWTLTRDDDVFSLTFRADALVTVISTTALEALYLEKPVVLLQVCGVRQPIPYVPSGAALQARSEAELTTRLREALYDEGVRARLAQARRAFVPRQLDIADGRAAARVADLIRTIAGA